MFQRVAEFHRAFGLPLADSPSLPESAVRQLRIALLQEELEEFRVAIDEANRIEIADALADICYIIAGTVVCYGLAPRIEETFESPYDQYLPQKDTASPLGMWEVLNDYFLDYEKAEHHDNLEWIDVSLLSMLTTVFGIAWQLNIPLNAVFAEVHRSNLSKLMPDGSVLRREDGKVMKSPNWSPPAIAQILADVDFLTAK